MEKIYVKIDEENFNKLKKKKGFMFKEAYPDFHKEFERIDEVGSFLDFRFISDKMVR